MRPPLISVIVPFHGSERSVLNCLRSLYDMDYPSERLEVIAIDDGAEDCLVDEVVHQFPEVLLVRNGLSVGRNAAKEIGIEKASGEIVAFTDSDCMVCRSWASVIERSLSADIDAVTGPVRHPRTPLMEMIAIADFPDFQNDEYSLVDSFVGCNYAIDCLLAKRLKLPACSLRMGSDRMLSWQFHRAGYKIAFDPSLIVEHRPKADLASILDRRLRYGMKALVMRRIDPTLPGAVLSRLGMLAPMAYMGFKLLKDTRMLFDMSRRGLVLLLHVPLLFGMLIACRLIDSVGIAVAQCRKTGLNEVPSQQQSATANSSGRD